MASFGPANSADLVLLTYVRRYPITPFRNARMTLGSPELAGRCHRRCSPRRLCTLPEYPWGAWGEVRANEVGPWGLLGNCVMQVRTFGDLGLHMGLTGGPLTTGGK